MRCKWCPDQARAWNRAGGRPFCKNIDSFLFRSMRSPAFLEEAKFVMRSRSSIKAALATTRFTTGGMPAMTKTTKTA